MKTLWSLALLVVFAVACTSTVTPPVARSTVPSWDGTNQNSGFIGYAPDGSGILTPHARDRYLGLVALYGDKFIPPLTGEAGLRPTATNTWLMDPQHLEYFLVMNHWRKQPKMADWGQSRPTPSAADWGQSRPTDNKP